LLVAQFCLRNATLDVIADNFQRGLDGGFDIGGETVTLMTKGPSANPDSGSWN